MISELGIVIATSNFGLALNVLEKSCSYVCDKMISYAINIFDEYIYIFIYIY